MAGTVQLTKPKIFNIILFTKKILPTPDLDSEDIIVNKAKSWLPRTYSLMRNTDNKQVGL